MEQTVEQEMDFYAFVLLKQRASRDFQQTRAYIVIASVLHSTYLS